ncbi:PTS sugar transporter subunit IIB [Vagococcus intermedius]|uniref:PTS sugar transporter subunit IIB n=1 Tax=Vagococcus intermedius TaxID=2991418 RepID=A0AAF0CUI3_9ENTE|nr:PTS sugar transporter subunit IIB [Vagococcus intermedius]WEG73106.1 PTS sugar transporter subunit IIB [Vagococcus intermedius]WEG75190.1 PTS sugar transporter subunit IIB [Vagococcus intermedius]
MTKKVMLCCGAGMSSGLLAQKARKSAKKQGLDVIIEARGESEVPQYFDSIDILLLGPHYANLRDEMSEMAAPYHLPVLVIPKEMYGLLDGAGVLKFALDELEKTGTE